MDELFKEGFAYIKARWHRKSTLLILVLFSAIVLLWFFSGINLEEITKNQIWIGGVLLLAVVGFWFYSNRTPKASVGKIGFFIGITSDNPDQQLKIKRDFVEAIKSLLYQSKYRYNFDFREIPDHILEKAHSFDTAQKLLNEMGCSFMIYGKARSTNIKGQPQHVLNLDGLVAHRPIPTEISKSFSREFADLFPKRLIISAEGDLFTFEFTANWVDAVSKYIISIAALLSGDFEYAQELLEDLQKNLADRKNNIPALAKIRERIPLRLREVYLVRLRMLYEDWKHTKDIELITKMKPFLDNLKLISPANAEANIYRAMWYFVAEHNIVKAKNECINAKDGKNPTWKYNYAFLFAYEGNLERAAKEYKQAFRGYLPYPGFLFEVIEFILWVLDTEPSMVQLHYCLGMIYYYVVGDNALAFQEYEKFIDATQPDQFLTQRDEAEDIISKIQKDIQNGKVKLED